MAVVKVVEIISESERGWSEAAQVPKLQTIEY